MLGKDIEQEMETIPKELDVCEKQRSDAVDNLFWQQMTYVVAGIAVMCIGMFLLERVYGQ